MAALIDGELGVAVEIEEGARGEFSVWVGEERVAHKDGSSFPEDADVVSAVSRGLASG